VFGEDIFRYRKHYQEVYVAVTDVYCLTVSRKDFFDIDFRASEDEREKKKFFSQIFKDAQGWNDEFLSYFEFKKIARNTTLYNQDQKADGLYLIKSGTIDLLKKF